MRYVYSFLLLVCVGCSHDKGADGDVASMEIPAVALETGATPVNAAVPPGAESESYSSTEVIDCMGGGTVQVQISWQRRDTPYMRRYNANWIYDECNTFTHGIVDGYVRYTRMREEKEEGADNSASFPHWATAVNYHADLAYVGGSDYECDAYVQLTKKTPGMIDDLALRDHCAHPASVWWGQMGF
jgi:hypothetical protein